MIESSIRADTDDVVDGGSDIYRHGDCSSGDGVGRLDCGTLRSNDAGRSGDVGYAKGDGASGSCGTGGQAKGCVGTSEGWCSSAGREDRGKANFGIGVNMAREVRGPISIVADGACGVLRELDAFGYLLSEGEAAGEAKD